MPVVINEFEVVPAPPKNENQAAGKKDEKNAAANEPPTDHELRRLLERRLEREERISAH